MRIEANGEATVLTDNYESMNHNSPNDLTIDSKGRIYFGDCRDTANGTAIGDAGQERQVFRRRVSHRRTGKVTRVIGHEVERANGVFVSQEDRSFMLQITMTIRWAGLGSSGGSRCARTGPSMRRAES